MLAFGATLGAHAQDRRAASGDGEQTVLPIWNNASGRLEALLVLEPADDGAARSGARLRFGGNRLDAAFGLESGDSLALLCNDPSGLSHALGNLANNCLLASLDDDLGDDGGRRSSATAAFSRPGGSIGLAVGESSGDLPAWMTSTGPRGGASQVDSNDLTVFAQKNISDQGFVSIAGTVAKARLIPYAQAPAGLADRWDSRSLTVGGGFGNFGANVIGQVIDTPGQPRWEGLGLGLTWRTPWSGQLTVGAENVVTRGRNPFSPRGENGEDEGTVPYVRYEQDL
ncbi:XOO1806 family protein [Luteimonas endophytica]|uniref:XOO1806 family protein n=1 Tax=Luteimonas endophytica TaxID=3042023 RepID=UPI003CE5B63A